jgi:hypothetical protein
MVAVVVMVLTAAVMFAIFRRDATRGYWIGFALTGWIYVLLCFYGIATSPSVSAHRRDSFYNTDPLGRENLITAQISGIAYDRLLAERRLESMKKRSPRPSFPTVVSGMDRDHFIVVSHGLWTWLLATCGGWFAWWLYASQKGDS